MSAVFLCRLDTNCTASNTHTLLSLSYFLFASPKKKVTKKKASFGQWLRRPKHSSTLLSQFATRIHGAGFLPTIAVD
jgi:hypothetical protein